MRYTLVRAYLLSLCLASSVGCKGPSEDKRQDAPSIKAPPAPVKKKSAVMGLTAAFKPALPTEFASAEFPITEEKIELGRMLYFDKRLSKSQEFSCNSCHLLDKFGADGEKTSLGHKKQRGSRNSPTVYNAAGHFVQFWDGRSPHVEHQATQPIGNPVEMAMPDSGRVISTLESIPEYVELFKKAFPEDKAPVTLENVGLAIGAFERRLVTPSRWDKFLKGESNALTDEEQQGFKAFMDAGCNACHAGTLIGGTMYQKAGLVQPWPNQVDQGRYEVTKQESDRMMFKVPSLRNVAETAPYFHDASAATLEEAVVMMIKHQTTREVDDNEVKKMVAWLKSLTGELPTEYIKEPTLPPSTDKTPKPDPN